MKKQTKKKSTLLIMVLMLGLSFLLVSQKKAIAGNTVLHNPTRSNGITTWDCVYFGSYPQSDVNGVIRDPIKWRVLWVDGKDIFLLSDMNLDAQAYHGVQKDVTWETCSLRKWLNTIFLNAAFTSAEQQAIIDTSVVNNDNLVYQVDGGNKTIDKVFLLSLDEILSTNYGFSSNYADYSQTRQAKNTEYAKAFGASTCLEGSCKDNGWWWLRTPGKYNRYAAYVFYLGYIYREGFYAYYDNYGVRPALHLNMDSSSWNYAGIVSAEGAEVSPTPTPNYQGDVDKNGSIELQDANLILKMALSIIQYTDEEKFIADINQDGNVDLEDANFTLKMALKIV